MKKVEKMCAVLNRGTKDEKRVYMSWQPAKVFWEANELYSKIPTINKKPEFDKAVKKICSWYEGLTFDDVMGKMGCNELVTFLMDSCQYLISGAIGSFGDLLDIGQENTQKEDEPKNGSTAKAE